ncbi:MAG: hypothetical protein JRD93_21725 [Deltaproteobacteria bacterium]|nr:hypothetical protein [Deltaproteobacteria bacterium]
MRPKAESDALIIFSGGFQGTSYGDAYNGFRGFPGRKTSFQEHESVSWSDTGLGWCEEED